MKDMLKYAKTKGYAVGAFNIVNYITASAVVKAAEEAKSPVVIQTSVSTVKQIGINELMSFLIPMAQNASIPVAVHLDHCTDIGMVFKCIDAGWSSVMYDGSKESFETNMKLTSNAVRYALGKDVSVEGELGAIVGVEEDICVNESDALMADPFKSQVYAESTGIHAFAPAIGTAHGLYKGEPKIDFERFKAIRGMVECPLVIHGGTGLSTEVFRRLIKLGAAKINVSTAIKISYIDSACEYINNNRTQYNPLKVDKHIEEAVKKTVLEHIYIFGSRG